MPMSNKFFPLASQGAITGATAGAIFGVGCITPFAFMYAVVTCESLKNKIGFLVGIIGAGAGIGALVGAGTGCGLVVAHDVLHNLVAEPSNTITPR